MIKITEVVLVWFGGDLIFRTYIYVFCELGPVKKTYIYVRRRERVKPLHLNILNITNSCRTQQHVS